MSLPDVNDLSQSIVSPQVGRDDIPVTGIAPGDCSRKGPSSQTTDHPTPLTAPRSRTYLMSMDVFASASLIGFGLSLSRRGRPGLRIFSATFILMAAAYGIKQDPWIWYGPDWKTHDATARMHRYIYSNPLHSPPRYPSICGDALWFFYERCDASSAAVNAAP